MSRSWWAMVGLVGLLALPSFGQDPSQVEQRIEQMYEEFAMAVRWKFAPGLMAHRSPTFVLLGTRGETVPAEAEQRNFRDGMEGPCRLQLSWKIAQWDFRPEVVRTRLEWKLSCERLLPQTRQRSIIQAKGTSEDEWVPMSSDWRLRRRRLLKVESHRQNYPL